MKDTKLTLEKAYELAVKKWAYIVENNGSECGLYKKHPELYYFQSGCSYCQMFREEQSADKIGCQDCPLNNGMTCFAPFSLFNEWYYHRTKDTAQAVLDLIIKTQPNP